MTAKIVGRPKRTRPIDRVNYKLDTGVRELLRTMSERKGRNEGAQVEQLILQGEAIDRIINSGEILTSEAIQKKITDIWLEITDEE